MIFGTEKPVTKTLEWIPVMFSVSYVNHHMGLTAKPVLCTSQAVLHSDSVCLYHYQATKLMLNCLQKVLLKFMGLIMLISR